MRTHTYGKALSALKVCCRKSDAWIHTVCIVQEVVRNAEAQALSDSESEFQPHSHGIHLYTELTRSFAHGGGPKGQ